MGDRLVSSQQSAVSSQPTSAWLALAAVCWVLTATNGCASVPLRAGAARAPQPLPTEIAAYYDYPAHAHQATALLLHRHRTVNEYLVRFPLSVPEGVEPTEPLVEFEWFESQRPGRRPAILFNPILGGQYPVERTVCRSLARRGFHVALIHRKTLKISPEQDVSHLEHLLRQGLLRIRQVTDWMAAQERVDADRMGSFGISMGGMAGVMAAAIEPRLKAHVVALAGGGLPDILVYSHDKMIAKPRAAYLANNHMDLQTMETALRESIRTDPIRLAPYVDRQRVLLVIALADRTIGRRNALRLRQALGYPRTVFLPFGHYSSYLALPYLQRVGAQFLRRELNGH